MRAFVNTIKDFVSKAYPTIILAYEGRSRAPICRVATYTTIVFNRYGCTLSKNQSVGISRPIPIAFASLKTAAPTAAN